ncbi:hypothetical protein F7731_24685 [Cytobacillus depressus]|uniref:Uncharacterized protein n=1 Tax=Cytobacillus depressus TaxID=1602942 RepID=A0A6L3UX34_9BACI|nr:hypothetical protein [Cytobacillus depressus]KAB2328624.1 hypothetical protein F7731_24685 [Cytobacillus depressus]
MDLNMYRNLPDYLSANEIKSHFNEVLGFVELNYAASPLAISEAFYELAERQWNTFEYLEKSLKNRVDNWVVCNWKIDNHLLTDNLLSLIALLGLEKSFLTAKAFLANTNLTTEVRKEIENTIKELEGNVSDPYSGMK